MWSTTVDPNLRSLAPERLPLAIIIISCLFLVGALICVGIRSRVRLAEGTFDLDDGLMAAGTVSYISVVGLACYGCFVGMGRLEDTLNQFMWSESLKIYIIWILNYVVALALVKSSVCLTIRRIITTNKPLIITVWVLLGLTWASFVITFIGTLLYCRPVEAMWTPALILSGAGECANIDVLIGLGHVATSSAIATDLALVVVPAIILWSSQMKRQTKFQVFGLLSFASLASIITMVRIPFVNDLRAQKNMQFWVAHIMLCSNIETGIGCIASSIPSLRRFFARTRGTTNGSAQSSQPSSNMKTGLFTFGSQPVEGRSRDRLRNQDLGFTLATVQGSRDEESAWERIRDGDSDKGELLSSEQQRGIKAEYTYQVDIEMLPAATKSSREVGV